MAERLSKLPLPKEKASYQTAEEWLVQQLDQINSSDRHKNALKAMDPDRFSEGTYIPTLIGFLTTFSYLRGQANEHASSLPKITPDHVDAARIAVSKRRDAVTELPKREPKLFSELQNQKLFPVNKLPSPENPYYLGALHAMGVVEAAATGQKSPVRRRAMHLPAA